MWDIKTGEAELELTFTKDNFNISAICHPSTYLDKVMKKERSLGLLAYYIPSYYIFVLCSIKAHFLFLFEKLLLRLHDPEMHFGQPCKFFFQILVGSEQGGLHLWNIKTTKLIYTFKGKEMFLNTYIDNVSFFIFNFNQCSICT